MAEPIARLSEESLEVFQGRQIKSGLDYMAKVDHPLLELATKMVASNAEERPTLREVARRLATPWSMVGWWGEGEGDISMVGRGEVSAAFWLVLSWGPEARSVCGAERLVADNGMVMVGW
jgi:hypothetical protein